MGDIGGWQGWSSQFQHNQWLAQELCSNIRNTSSKDADLDLGAIHGDLAFYRSLEKSCREVILKKVPDRDAEDLWDAVVERHVENKRWASIKNAKVLDKVWVVRDPEPESELVDILSECDAIKLAQLVLGTGITMWKRENTTLHDSKDSALKDAKDRLSKKYTSKA